MIAYLIRLMLLFPALAVAWGCLGTAQACYGNKVLLEDKFEIPGPSTTWFKDPELQIKQGKMVGRAKANSIAFGYHLEAFLPEADICVTVTLAEPSTDSGNSLAGLMFWVQGPGDFFVFLVSSDGKFSVGRRVGYEWVANPVKWTVSEALKQGPSQSNRIRLKLYGERATAYINDEQVVSFRGQAPEGRNVIGLFTQSPPASSDTWTFSNFIATNVAR